MSGGSSAADAAALVWTAPPAVLAVIGVGTLAVVALALRGSSDGGDPRLRWLGVGAHLAAWAVLAVALAGPAWIQPGGREEPAPLVVLVDGSASMGVTDAAGPRAATVPAALDAIRASTDGPVEVFTFDDDLRPGLPARYDGRGSDLGGALAALADRTLGQRLSGVVVLTDGIDRGALRRDLRAAAAGGSVGAEVLPPLAGPLTLVAIGDADDVFDVAIEDVATGGYAFLRAAFPLTARLRGPPGRTVPVLLSREGRREAEASATFGEDGTAEVRFEVTPRKVGRFAWEVSTPVEAPDAVPANNTFPVVLRVVRDRTRVLQVAGAPSNDQKFLRLFLKEDPSVDLVSFFILRTDPDLRAGWDNDEVSLIEFPYERLFEDDLESFDLVILQNFNHGPYLDRSIELLENVARWTEAGGALVMVGGDRSFDLGDYQGTPVERVLPVRLGVGGPRADEAPFVPVLTPDGAAHPLPRLLDDAGENARRWEGLPALDGLNLTRGAARGAAVLLTHPGRRCEDGNLCPVLAVAEPGQGRSLALTVDASWRWSFSEAASGRGNQAYLRFWKNAFRWLVADPDDRQIVVRPGRDNVVLGDEVVLIVEARDAGHRPLADVVVEGEVVDPAGNTAPINGRTGADGELKVPLQPGAPGAWRVRVTSPGLPGQVGETVFAATAREPELSEIRTDHAFLEQVAGLLGEERARYIGPGASLRPLLDPAAVRVIPERHQEDLGSHPGVALAVGLLGGLGFWARRRAGGR